MFQERVIETDVLVIGAGMAGFFAALKARERGADVTITDKAYVGKSGSTHFSEGDMVYFRPERGHKLEEWVNLISERAEYVNNRDWDEICLKEAEDRHKDLLSWGVEFYQKDGSLYIFSFGGASYEDVALVNRKYSPTLRHKSQENGIRIIDNIMVGELIRQGGSIVGAIGFHTNSGNLYVFKAKATVIATGSSSLKAGAYPTHFWTGDGEAMAYRAGAEIVGKEFQYGMHYFRSDVMRRRETGGTGISGEIIETSYRYPFAITGGLTGGYNQPSLNVEGGAVVFPPWEAHCGRAPLYIDLDSLSSERKERYREFFKRIEMAGVQTEKIGLDVLGGGKVKWPPSRVQTSSIFTGSGICPVNTDCATAVQGLYAAGNSCGTMATGAMYGTPGFASNHAAVTGARAGLAAAEYANKSKKIIISEEELKTTKDIVSAPIERIGGFGPAWITQVLHAFTIPYFIFDIKHEARLQPALALIEFVKNHLVPKVMAKDAHEWRMAHEIRNLVLIAEMRLRSSIFRTESRGNHFREDYPQRDDPNWLAWVKIQNDEGEMKLIKESLPQAWWPDLTKPKEELYPRILPME